MTMIEENCTRAPCSLHTVLQDPTLSRGAYQAHLFANALPQCYGPRLHSTAVTIQTSAHSNPIGLEWYRYKEPLQGLRLNPRVGAQLASHPTRWTVNRKEVVSSQHVASALKAILHATVTRLATAADITR